MDYLFESDRLGFRQWKSSDILSFFEVCSDPRVMEFFPSTLSYQETQGLVERIKTGISNDGFGFFAAELLATSKFIGFIGAIYQTMEAPFTPCYEIGWRLSPSIWNQGLATEGAKACLEYMSSNFPCDEIYSITPVQNVKSERIMQKIGMSHYGYFEHPKLEEDSPLRKHTIYRRILSASKI